MNCIFCKKISDDSKSVEHIVPESMGNISGRHLLPKGIVCDSCNNYFATSIEAPILNHISFRNLRAKYQTPTKKGKIPYLQGYALNTDIEVGLRLNNEKNDIDIFALKESQKGEFERLRRLDRMYIRPNILTFPMTLNPPQKEMSRFLAKMAYEALFARFLMAGKSTEEASKIVNTTHYDNIRNWARYGSGWPEWPYHYRQYCPEETLMKHPETKAWVQFGFAYNLLLTPRPETFFVFSCHGHEFAINLGGPSIKGYKIWLDDNNHVSVLIEKIGYQIQEITEFNETKYYMVPLLLLDS